jgi:hypothetical protein
VRNEKVLHTDKEERNIIHIIKRRKANWFGDVLPRNRLLEHTVEGMIEGMRRRGRKRKNLLDDLKKERKK